MFWQSVCQKPLRKFCQHSAWMVWKKEMEGGKVAVLLMNNQNFTSDVNISWTDLPDDMHFRCSAGGQKASAA